MPPKQPLETWLAEIFFEDNQRFGRRASRVGGMLRKMFATVPQAAALLFCNFAATYPRSRSAGDPKPLAPAADLDLTLDEWPKHPQLGSERGLPYSDGVVRSLNLGDALGSVTDLIFVMREVHRVCAPGAVVKLRSVAVADLERDPTLVRPVTAETLSFFTGSSAKAKRYNAANLFTLTDEMTLQRVGSSTPARALKIDIGCGTTPRPGYTGIDFLDLPGVEIIRDVERHGLPFSDSTISHVYTAHFLEHVQSLVFVMNEIHRVCCHDALVEISVPTLLGPYAAADPTHVHFFNARTFSYFEAGSEPYAGIVKGFEILEQSVGFSLNVKLRVVKN